MKQEDQRIARMAAAMIQLDLNELNLSDKHIKQAAATAVALAREIVRNIENE